MKTDVLFDNNEGWMGNGIGKSCSSSIGMREGAGLGVLSGIPLTRPVIATGPLGRNSSSLFERGSYVSASLIPAASERSGSMF